MVLPLGLDAPVRQARQRLHHQRCSSHCQNLEKINGRLVRPDRHFLLQQHRPRIQALFEQHRRIPRHGLAHCYRPLNRRSPAILRQERPVQIDAAEARQRQHPLWNDAAISHDHNRIRPDGFQPATKLDVVANLVRLRNLQP